MKSIRARLLFWVMGLVLLSWAAVTFFTWRNANLEIHRLFDAQLAQVAEMLALTTLHETTEGGRGLWELKAFVESLQHDEYRYPVLFQIQSGDGRFLHGPGPDSPRIPEVGADREGYSNLTFDGRAWRVYTLFLKDMGGRIQVASTLSARHEVILKFVLNILKPLLLLLPLTALLWFGIDRSLAPLRWVAREIAGRDQWNFAPLSTSQVPKEIRGLVDEINGLLSRLHATIDRHSRFASDAAHELRTPLAGAMTQLQLVMDPRSPRSRRQRALEQTLKGLRRLSHRVDQLLVLAGVEPEQARGGMQPLALSGVVESVVAEQRAGVDAGGVRIEVRANGPAIMHGNRELIEILIRNLLNNALQAVAGTGQITLETSADAAGAMLRVEDTGPGIPEEALEQVFDRSHRLLDSPRSGFGLGLSIVRAIVEAHGGAIALANRPQGSGLSVTVHFPASSG